MTSHVLYLVGRLPRVGKSVLAQQLLHDEGIAWLPTGVLRTVLRRVLPEVDAAGPEPRAASLAWGWFRRGVLAGWGTCSLDRRRERAR